MSCTYTYLLGCPATKQAILIDPVIELVQRDLNLVKQLGLQVRATEWQTVIDYDS